MIHDVTTDPDNPPAFIALRETRLACPNGAEYSGLPADEHRQRYPDLMTAVFEQQVAHVFGVVLAFAEALDWKIAAAVESEGRIEATATTRVFRFKDDVVIRIRPAVNGSRLDARSASRVGSSDFGVNARRLRALLNDINSTLKTNT